MDYDTDYKAISPSAIKRAILRRGKTAEDSELSMLHMRHEMTRPRTDKGTDAMQWGTACHAAVLEPDRLAVWQGYINKKGKLSFSKSANAWEEFCDANPDRLCVTAPQYESLLAVRDAVMGNAEARSLLEGARYEVPLQWDDPELGPCKGKPDALFANPHCARLADLKMMRDASPTAISAAIWRAGTDLQLAWYRRGMSALALCGGGARSAVIAVESGPPHSCVVAEMPPQFLDAAEEMAVAIAKRYRVHELCGSFPGPCESGRMTYEPPPYASGDAVPEITDEDM
jgi:hypothetical protein